MYPASVSPVRLTRDLIGRPAGYLLPLIAGIALGVAAACVAGQAPWGDQSMYLVAAGKALDGLEFGREIIDVNPPLILWLSEIPVAVARATGVLPQSAMAALIGLVTVAILVWCLRLAAAGRAPSAHDPASWLLAALLLYATTIHPWYHLATREHIVVLFLLPYVFLAAGRVSGGVAAGRGQAFGAGALGIAAAGIKPQYLLVLFALEAMLLYRRRSLATLRRPEMAGMIAGGLVYALAVALLAPQYLTVVVPFAYGAYLDRGLADWGELILPARAIKIVLAIAAWAALRRLSGFRALGDAFMVAALAATLAYVMQRKGYEYQLVPALAFYHLAVGTVIAGLVVPHLAAPPRSRIAMVGALCTAAIAGAIYYPYQAARAANYWSDDRKVARLAITPHIPPGTTVFMISPVVGPIHDDLLRYGLNWGSRFTVFWMTEALMTRDLSLPANAELAQWTRRGVVADLRRYRPSIILVERCPDRAFRPCEAMGDGRGDLLGWFLADPAFRAEWSHYARRSKIEMFDVWCAIDDATACPALLADLPRN